MSESEPGIRDIQSYSYVTDTGQRINVTLVESEKVSGKNHGGRDMAVTIDVDGVNRLTCDNHFSTIGDFGLGEYMLKAVMSCLGEHLDYWIRWQEFIDVAMADEYKPPRVVVGDPEFDVRESNVAARHIEQLTDEQAWWWLTDPELTANGSTTNGGEVATHLVAVGIKKWDEWFTQNKVELDKLASEKGLTVHRH